MQLHIITIFDNITYKLSLLITVEPANILACFSMKPFPRLPEMDVDDLLRCDDYGARVTFTL